MEPIDEFLGKIYKYEKSENFNELLKALGLLLSLIFQSNLKVFLYNMCRCQ